jgi:hypothetical protein
MGTLKHLVLYALLLGGHSGQDGNETQNRGEDVTFGQALGESALGHGEKDPVREEGPEWRGQRGEWNEKPTYVKEVRGSQVVYRPVSRI